MIELCNAINSHKARSELESVSLDITGNITDTATSTQNDLFVLTARPLPERAADQPLGLHHLAVWVEDLEGLAARLAAAGYPLTGPIRSVSRWVGAALRVAWIEDPDGVKIELLGYVGPAGD